MSSENNTLNFKVYLLCNKAQQLFQNCQWKMENRSSLGCESSPCVDLGMEGALGRLSLVFFLVQVSPWFSRNYCSLRQRSSFLLIDSVFHLSGNKTPVVICTASVKNLDNEFEGFGELLCKKITRKLQYFTLVLCSINSQFDFWLFKTSAEHCFFSLSLFKKMALSCLFL